MIPVGGGIRIYLYRQASDMRKGFYGLSGIVREHFREDLFSGSLFVFVNRRLNRVKVLYWDRDGLAIWYKRLERGSYRIPEGNSVAAELNVGEFNMLLEGITPLRVSRRYRREAVIGSE